MGSEIINLNDTLPAPSPGFQNAKWQKGATTGNDPTYGVPVYPVSDEVPNTGGTVVHTASYTAVAADCGLRLIFNSASALTLTLPATPPFLQWQISAQNIGAGVLTVSRNGLLIDTAAANLTLPQNSGVDFSTDLTNYFTGRGLTSTTGLATQAGVQQESYIAAADTGAANAYAVALTPAPTIGTYSSAVFKAANTNTGASTLAVNGGAAVAIHKNGSAPLVAGDIVAGQIVHATYDGTFWQISAVPAATISNVLFVQGTSQVAAGSGNNVKAFTSNNTAGNCIVVDVAMPMGSAFTSPLTVTDSNGNTYTQIVPNQTPGLSMIYACFAALNIAGGANTVTLNVANGAFGTRPYFTGMAIHEYTGVATASALDAYTEDVSGTSLSLPLTLTTTTAGDLLHAFAGDNNGGAVETYGNSGGWPQREILPFTATANWPQMASFDNPAGAAGSYSNTLTITSGSGAASAAAIMIALKAKPTGVGSVISVSASVPSFLTVAVSNPNSTPAIAITATPEAANLILASPNGSAGPMAPRLMVPADMPAFLASGASHAAGAVPDPGATAGTTKFLREDATWVVPAGGGGSGVPSVNGITGAVTIAAGSGATVSTAGTTVTIGASGGGGGALTQISKQVLSSAAATVSFTGISGAYTNLILTISCANSASEQDVYMQFNGDTGSNYDWEAIVGGGSGTVAGAATYATAHGLVGTSPFLTNQAGSIRATIHDYSNTSFYKNSSSLCQRKDAISTGYILTFGHTWRSLAAITSILLGPLAGNFAAGSIFTLYAET